MLGFYDVRVHVQSPDHPCYTLCGLWLRDRPHGWAEPYPPRHGTAYVGAWIKALENDPREIRAAAVDVQRISDWLMARERERTPLTSEACAAPPARHDAVHQNVSCSEQIATSADTGNRQCDLKPSR